MSNNTPHDNWSEFQWENELRRDELRIRRYFQALSACVDLPDEEETIFKGLMAQKDLVPSGTDSRQALTDFYFRNDAFGEDDEFQPLDLSRKNGFEQMRQLDKLAADWTAFFSSRLANAHFRDGLGIICRFGKLLSRFYNFLEIDETDQPILKISLGKRLLADLNDLMGSLRNLVGHVRSDRGRIEEIIEHLQHIRENIVDIELNLRSTFAIDERRSNDGKEI